MTERALRTAAVVSMIIITLIVFAASGDCKENARESRGASQPNAVSLCLGGAPGIFLLLAHEQGFFAAEGVTVNLMKHRTTTEGLEHFFKGECDLSSISETAIVMKSFERRDFSILATYATSDDATNILASRKSGINFPKDLKGKRIYVPQWSSNHYFLFLYLARHGISHRDVKFVFSKVPDLFAALQSGLIHASCVTKFLNANPRADLRGDALVLDAPGLYLASYGLAAQNSLIRAKPDVIRKVIAALLRTET